MYLRKRRAGGGAGFEWTHDGAVVEVPDHIGHELIGIPDGGFAEVRPDQLDDGPTPGVDLATLRGELLRAIDEHVAVAVDLMRAGLLAEVLAAVGAGGVKTLTAEGPAAPAAVSPPGASAAAASAGDADAPGTTKTARPAGGNTRR